MSIEQWDGVGLLIRDTRRETGTFDLIDELTVTYRVDDCGTLIDERIDTPRVEISHGQTRQRR